MGFFNRQKKKAEQETHGIGYQYSSINQQLFREVTQEVALFMFEVGITKQPGLSCFYDDKGILKAYLFSIPQTQIFLRSKGYRMMRICRWSECMPLVQAHM